MLRILLAAVLLCSWSVDYRSQLARESMYFALGKALDSIAQWALFGATILPDPLGKECLLISQSCRSGARHAFTQLISKKKPISSHTSWEENRDRLAQIPATSPETAQLLGFLQNHWLAKLSGFHSFIVDWVCPCFDVPIQVHPFTTSAYFRDPASQMSRIYMERMQKGKQCLPQPQSFPLLLTRPFDIRPYLPPFVEVLPEEPADALIERAAGKILDVTDRFSDWQEPEWETFRKQMVRACQEHLIDPSQLTCIQRVQTEEVTGIRLLPLTPMAHTKALLEWISEFGLSATRVELEGMPLPIRETREKSLKAKPHRFVFHRTLDHPQKRLFIETTLQILNGLFDAISEDHWASISNCPVRSAALDLSITKIREEFEKIAQEEMASFFHTASRMEEIHAHLSSLLAICNPFVPHDFAPIYLACLKHIKSPLKALVSCGIHSSAMASFAGILKAAEKTAGHKLLILYGENTYFECINTIEQLANQACPTQEATEEQWAEVDLIVAQFNPALKRPAINQQDLNAGHYRVEPIAEMLHRALFARKNKPLTVALDCTFDFLESPLVAKLLEEFQEAILAGTLNVVCYRSGLKFDLLGMDNHAGAPFAFIHQGKQWAFFDALLDDPALQIDPLSLQWFCLAYQHAAPELDFYRKQIFENTRAILDRVPTTLYSPDARYRIVPMEKEVYPGFIDFKISGPFHAVRAAAVVGGYLFSQCLEQGHPIFNRRSVGFYHPNFSLLFGKHCSTIRLTIGVDPAQIDLFVRCFKQIDQLNH